MKDIIEKSEIEAENELARAGFTGSIEIKSKDETPNFDACIDKKSLSKINISVNPEYEDNHPGKTIPIVRDIVRHEVNHKKYLGFNGCPRNLDNHVELIIEPMYKVLKSEGYNKNDVHYLANCLEDTILHSDLNREFSLDGIADFYDDVGNNTDNKKYTPFFEAHLKLHLYISGNNRQKAMIGKYFTHPEEVKDVITSFLDRTGISRIKTKLIDGTEVKDDVKIRDYLNDKNNWKDISRIYAEEFSKLMKPGYAMPIPGHSGKDTTGSPSKEGNSQEGNNSEQPQAENDFIDNEESEGDQEAPEEGNQFDKEMYSEESKKARIKKAHAKEEDIPNWMNSFEALDLLYQSLAQNLIIKAESFTNQDSYPVMHYGQRPFNPDRDNFKQVIFGFSDKGELELRKRRWNESIPIEYKESPKGFPEIRFCLLDTSSSMLSAIDNNGKGRKNIIPWGDNTRYHHALLGWYGLLEYLKQNHLLQQQNVSLANFSSSTYLSNGLLDAKKLALSPQFRGTNLDMNSINNMFANKDMLIFTISDGEIANWGNIRDSFIKKAKDHHYFHLQIGNSSYSTNDLEQEGLKVEYIKHAGDLAERVIDLTDKLYRGK